MDARNPKFWATNLLQPLIKSPSCLLPETRMSLGLVSSSQRSSPILYQPALTLWSENPTFAVVFSSPHCAAPRGTDVPSRPRRSSPTTLWREKRSQVRKVSLRVAVGSSSSPRGRARPSSQVVCSCRFFRAVCASTEPVLTATLPWM